MNATVQVGFDNRVQPGSTTRDEILASAESSGLTVRSINEVTDPVSGNLVRADMVTVLADGAALKAAVDGTGGVASSSVPLPDPLFAYDVTAVAAATLDLAARDEGAGIIQRIKFGALEESFNGEGILFGTLEDVGAGDAFVDGDVNANGNRYMAVTLENRNPAAAVTLSVPAGDITVTADGSGVVLNNTAPLTLDSVVGEDTSVKSYYVDAAGNMYLAYHQEGNVDEFGGNGIIVPLRSYAEAVAAGAV